MESWAIILILSVIAIVFVLIIPKILLMISHLISLIGLYHKLIPTTVGEKTEPFWTKYFSVFACYTFLTLPFFLGYILLLMSTFRELSIQSLTMIALTFTLITLVVMRIITNPTKKFFKPGLLLYVNERNPAKLKKKKRGIIENHKERMMSFFFAFISTAFILLIIWGLVGLYQFIQSPQTSQIPIDSSLILFFFEVLLFYIVMLLIFTLVGELILKELTPCVQYPTERDGKSITFFCEKN